MTGLNREEVKRETKQQIAKPSLKSLLAIDNSQTTKITQTTKNNSETINLSNKSTNLGDILKLSNSLEKAENKKMLQPTDKVTKFTGVSKEIVSSLFTDEELRDLGIETKLAKAENEISEETTVSDKDLSIAQNEKIKSGLELKIGEAKTMTRHLAMNLQEQVENYKSPFQKLTLTLNPQKLGEVDVDIIKRGNNVKITLSGTSNTINILSANSMELRNQLINVGLDNPSFKFNEDGRNGSQQQQREHRESDEVTEEDKENFEIEVLSLV